jgi:hypothetical protein
MIETLLRAEPPAKASPGWALFAYRRGAQALLAGVAHGGKPRRIALEWQGRRPQLGACAAFLVAAQSDRFSVLFRDPGTNGDTNAG